MASFESQLTDLAQQHKATMGKKLKPVANPRMKRSSAAWIATPIAAAIGLLIGLFFHFNHSTPINPIQIVEIRDTVFQQVHDTIFKEKPNGSYYAYSDYSKAAEKNVQRDSIKRLNSQMGKSILEDDIDYNLLVVN